MSTTFRASYPSVIVVDDFFVDPAAVRKIALEQTYNADNSKFRGKRSDKAFRWPGLREALAAMLDYPIVDWDDQGFNGVFQITTGGDQLVYHSDLQRWAGAVYLTPDAPPEAGTTLYRSKSTKLRAPHEDTSGASQELISRRMYQGKLLDRTAWEVVDVVGNRYNRLVLWDGRLVHSASAYFGTNQTDGRLVQLFFFG